MTCQTNEKLWGNFRHDGDIDVVPVNDDKEHVAGADCGCHPTVEVYGSNLVIIHNAYDFREVKEQMDTLIQDCN